MCVEKLIEVQIMNLLRPFYIENNLATQLYKVSPLLEGKIEREREKKEEKGRKSNMLVVHHYYTGQLSDAWKMVG